MRKAIRIIKRLFGKYEPGYEYWISRKKIKISPYWYETKRGKRLFRGKMYYWGDPYVFESKIILDKKLNLVNGYYSLKIADEKGMKKVPVYFED